MAPSATRPGEREAETEKAHAAERDVALIRLVVVAANSLIYAFLLDPEGTLPWLAYPLIPVALGYSAWMAMARPSERYGAFATAYGASILDAVFITLWIAATGGIASPFHILYYGSLAAVAYRFDARGVATAATLYASAYLGLAFVLGDVASHFETLVIRVAYIFLIGALMMLLARASHAQFRDTVDMRNRMVAARTAEARFRNVLEAAPDAMVLADRGGRIVLVNTQTERVFGHPREALLGEPVDLLFPTRCRGAIPTPVEATGPREAGTGVSLELLGLRRDGSEFPVEIRLSPLHTEEGPLVTVAIRDVTERKRAEEALARTLHEREQIMEAIPDILYMLDARLRLVRWNRKFEETTGLDAREVTARPVVEFFPEADRSRISAAIQAALETGYGEVDGRLVVADGNEVLYHWKIVPLRDEDGTLIGYTGVGRDLTERKRAEEERLTSMQRLKELDHLRELDRFKTRFINMAAHELGTPLTPIKLQLHLLKQLAGGDGSHKEAKAIRILDRNIDRLAHLVEDILAGARLQAERLSVHRTDVDVNRIVLEAVESFHESARQAGIQLETHLEPDLTASADAKRLTQVLFNLLSNAIKFTPPGGRVVASTRRAGDGVEVRVTDTGVGLSRDQISRLFQPFSQVHDTSQRTVGGTGLGLYISRGIVELHHGRLWVESDGPGHGSTFAFSLGTETPVPAADEEGEDGDEAPVDAVVETRPQEPEGGVGPPRDAA